MSTSSSPPEPTDNKDQKIRAVINKISETRQTFFLSLVGFALSSDPEKFKDILESSIRLSQNSIYLHNPNTHQENVIE